jgi:hypothetical protein
MAPSPTAYPRSLRIRLDMPARLALRPLTPSDAADAGTAEPPSHPVQLVDLSPRGAFVETSLLAKAGASAKLDLVLFDGPLQVEAVVARVGTALKDIDPAELDALVVRVRGLGLRFVSLRAEERKRLENHVRKAREGRS